MRGSYHLGNGGKGEVRDFCCAHRGFYQFVDRQRALPRFRLVEARARRRIARREQRATVLIGNDRDGITAEDLRLRHDFVLVHTDERTEERYGRDLSHHGQVLERLRRHLPHHVAGHQCLRVTHLCNALRDAQHQTPVHHDPHRRRHRQHHLLLDVAERHQVEPRSVLPLREQRRQRPRLFNRSVRQDRIAVEVDEGDRAAALHHPPRRHR
jgi:hypothetical protein